MNLNLLGSPDQTVRSAAFALQRDKTVYAYANFKFDGKPFRARGHQDAILSDGHDRILFCGANQVLGKSLCMNVDAAIEFSLDHGKNWVGIIVSGALSQSQFQMARVKNILRSSRITYREEEVTDTKLGKKDNYTQLSFTFYEDDKKTPKYTNLLICCPHTSSALGYPADNLWLDEFDWWENCDQQHFINQIAIPRTFETKGKIKVYTNPNGREKMMCGLWNQQDASGRPMWHRYHFNYWDSEGATQEKFDRLTRGMTRFQVDSTLLAVFSKSEGSFLSSEEIADMHDAALAQKGDSAGYGRETAWFMDVGAVHDQCYLVGGYVEPNPALPEIPMLRIFWLHKYPVGYPLGRVVGIPPDDTDGWADLAKDNPSLKTVFGEYAIPVGGKEDKKFQPLFGFDATGNAGMLPLLKAAGIEAVDVVFSGKLKWHMYQRFQYYVQQRFIKRAEERDENTVRGCDFDHQLSRLVVKKDTKTSYHQVHHESEDDLDDAADATVGFIHLIENPDLSSLSFDIINSKGESVVNPDGTLKKDEKKPGEEEGKKDEMDRTLEGQYLPSWMDRGEVKNWMEQRGELK